jgi:hypothetical protein
MCRQQTDAWLKVLFAVGCDDCWPFVAAKP